MTDAAADITVVIPNWNGCDLLEPCLRAVRAGAGALRVETIVVDNASSDGSIALLRQRFPEVRLIENARNEGFARACNAGVRASTAPFVLLLNTDAIVAPATMERMLALMRARPAIGVIGPQLRNADGSFQSARAPFPNLWLDWMILSGLGRLFHGAAYPCVGAEEESGAQPADWVGGACMLVRRQAFEEVGGLDDGYFMYAEEMDLCYRLQRARWQVWYEPAAVVTHLGAGSSVKLGPRSEATHYRSRLRFYELHHGAVQARLVRWMIFAATAVKIVVHSTLRSVTGGRRGRTVVSLRQLRTELRQG